MRPCLPASFAMAPPDEVRDPTDPRYGMTFLRDIFVVDVGTGVSQRLTDAFNDPGWVEWVRHVKYGDPAWSPDGERLAYIRHIGGPTPTANSFGYSLQVLALSNPHRTIAGPFSGRAVQCRVWTQALSFEETRDSIAGVGRKGLRL